MAKTNNLTDFLTDLADTIRTNTSTTRGKINPQDFSSDIALGTKTITPSTASQTFTAYTDDSTYGYKTVTVGAVTSSIDSNIVASNIKKDVTILGVKGTLDSSGIHPSGTATELDVRSGCTYYVSDTQSTGSMPDASYVDSISLSTSFTNDNVIGVSNGIITVDTGTSLSTEEVVSNSGYATTGDVVDIYTLAGGTINLTTLDTDFKASNIVSGVNMFGIDGTATVLSGETRTETLTTNPTTYTPSTGKNGITSIKVTAKSGSVNTPDTTIKVNPTLSTTYTASKGYLLSVSASQSVTPNVSTTGWITSGTSGTITVQNADTPSYVSQSTWGTGTAPSGTTPTSLAYGTTYKMSSGYYPSDRYYSVPSDRYNTGYSDGESYAQAKYEITSGTLSDDGVFSGSNTEGIEMYTQTFTNTYNSGYSDGVSSVTMETLGYTSEDSLGGSLSGTTYTVSTPQTKGYHDSKLTKDVTPSTLGLTSETSLSGSLSGTTYTVKVPNVKGYHTTQISSDVTPSTLGLTSETSLSGTLSGTTYTVKTPQTKGYHTSQLTKAVTPSDCGLTAKAATTYTPTTTDQTIATNVYTTGVQTISGDANLVASNIKKDTTIFGVTGTLDSSGIHPSGTAATSDVRKGKTYYVGDTQSTGTMEDAVGEEFLVVSSSISNSSVMSTTSGVLSVSTGTSGTSVNPISTAGYAPTTLTSTVLHSADGSINLTTLDTNFKAENIAKDVTVFGITGTHSGGITPSGNIEITNPTSTDVTNYATATVKSGSATVGNFVDSVTEMSSSGLSMNQSGDIEEKSSGGDITIQMPFTLSRFAQSGITADVTSGWISSATDGTGTVDINVSAILHNQAVVNGLENYFTSSTSSDYDIYYYTDTMITPDSGSDEIDLSSDRYYFKIIEGQYGWTGITEGTNSATVGLNINAGWFDDETDSYSLPTYTATTTSVSPSTLDEKDQTISGAKSHYVLGTPEIDVYPGIPAYIDGGEQVSFNMTWSTSLTYLNIGVVGSGTSTGTIYTNFLSGYASTSYYHRCATTSRVASGNSPSYASAPLGRFSTASNYLTYYPYVILFVQRLMAGDTIYFRPQSGTTTSSATVGTAVSYKIPTAAQFGLYTLHKTYNYTSTTYYDMLFIIKINSATSMTFYPYII